MFQLLELRRGAGSLFCERMEEVGAAVEAYFLGFYFCHSSAFLEDHTSGHVLVI